MGAASLPRAHTLCLGGSGVPGDGLASEGNQGLGQFQRLEVGWRPLQAILVEGGFDWHPFLSQAGTLLSSLAPLAALPHLAGLVEYVDKVAKELVRHRQRDRSRRWGAWCQRALEGGMGRAFSFIRGREEPGVEEVCLEGAFTSGFAGLMASHEERWAGQWGAQDVPADDPL